MARVLGRHALSEKDMAEMAATVVADDFSATSVGVRVAVNGSGNLVVETGPTTMTVEFIL
jgi:hypothetical protein